jgi:hypothetical protein
MTITRTAVDHDVLPAALLPMVKEHLRVRHDRDDTLITSYIASAIGLLERQCNIALEPASYVCTADELNPGAVGPQRPLLSYALPLNNVRVATLTDEAAEPPADHSDEFELWNPDFGGNGSSYLVQVAPPVPLALGWLVELDVGVLDSADLAPAVAVLIARMTGALYENREASAALWADTWAAEVQALWRPAV